MWNARAARTRVVRSTMEPQREQGCSYYTCLYSFYPRRRKRLVTTRPIVRSPLHVAPAGLNLESRTCSDLD